MDLLLAPVAAEIDRNLQHLRDKPLAEIEPALELELDRRLLNDVREERAARVLSAAIRNVDLRGWNVSISSDGARLHLSGGSVTLDLGLSASLLAYVERER